MNIGTNRWNIPRLMKEVEVYQKHNCSNILRVSTTTRNLFGWNFSGWCFTKHQYQHGVLWMCRQTATATKPTSDMPWNTSWFTTGSLFHGLLWTLYKGVVLFHPLYRANNQGLGRCLGLRLRHLTIAQDCHTEESLLMCQKHISQKHLKNTSAKWWLFPVPHKRSQSTLNPTVVYTFIQTSH